MQNEKVINPKNLNSKKELLEQLYDIGHIQYHFDMPDDFKSYVHFENWNKVDSLIYEYLGSPNGLLYKELIQFHDFKCTEHIIAIRSSDNDEDGIWHDDGSRSLAFTWSLNERPEKIQGGELLFRKKMGLDYITIAPPPLGELIIFLTGKYGFEHKVNQVTKGLRKTIAGWCS